ncbi:MAG: hypothetical protein SFV17_03430 [Candidatus Obscuribacter sp.]|nr:hypothetical protein [Candidatus Melainabacteria bacterium]MDX1985718.1 hypothetical protein [Candidatus Obscuribacter sp.]
MDKITLRSLLIIVLSGTIFVFSFPALGATILPSGFGIPFVLFLLYGILVRLLFEMLSQSRTARSNLGAFMQAFLLLYCPPLVAVWLFSLAGLLLVVSWPLVFVGTFLTLLIALCVLMFI